MGKNRDPLAPVGPTDEQLEAIRRNHRIVELRKESVVDGRDAITGGNH
jgi:hypothetical protein